MTEHDEQMVLADLADLARRAEAPSARLEQSLLNAFRGEQRRKARLRNWIAYGALAASIAVLSVAALLSRRETPRQRMEAAEVQPSWPAAAEAVTAAPVIAKTSAAPRRRAARRPEREIAEVATEFMRIPDASLLAPMESGHVVRVRVPRSAMLEFGLPINENRASELVKADVVLGEDGLARAIRFVQ